LHRIRKEKELKVKDAINEAGLMIPDHNVNEELLYIWLNRVQGLVGSLISEKELPRLQSELDELAVPEPYSALYPLYLQTMIYLYLGEYDRYNYLNSLFEASWSDYAKYYIRNK